MSRSLRHHLDGRSLSAITMTTAVACLMATGCTPSPVLVGGSGSGGGQGAMASGGHPGSTGTGGTDGTASGGVGSVGGMIIGSGSGGVGGRGSQTGGGGAAGGTLVACGASGGSSPIIGPGRSLTTPTFTTLGSAVKPPPPVAGGTLLVLRNGVTAVAADADRDQAYVIDLADPLKPQLRGTIPLLAGDQPGRLVEDAAGQVHVVLRNAAALVTIDPVTATVTLRRSICQLPRGIAYDKTVDRLFVACAGGELLTIAPTAPTAERTLKLGADLRDVVVDGDKVLVTRFRSAQLLAVDRGSGALMEQMAPSPMEHLAVRQGVPFEPAVAWRAVPMAGGGLAMAHQRGMKGQIPRTRGGYGGPVCDTIVHTAVSRMKVGQATEAGPAIPGFPLPVDMALSADGKTVALVSAGNGRSASGRANRLFVSKMDDVSKPWSGGCANDGVHGPPTCTGTVSGAGGRAGTPGATGGAGGGAATAPSPVVPPPVAPSPGCRDLPNFVEPTAVAFVGADVVLVQTREPAQLWVVKQASNDPALAGAALPDPSSITLSADSRADLGHAVFHSNSGAGLSCASCHPEGHEDGRTWNFQCEGERRTQDIGGGLRGTEPFHWKGDLSDFGTLMNNVFMGRMGGPLLNAPQMETTLNWINSIPGRPAPRLAREPAVERGSVLFHDPQVGCASCHTGAVFTNNATIGVTSTAPGGGEPFQVPSLRGVAWRAPYMHNGCAPDLTSRFSNSTCGGGDTHGKTSQLRPEQLADLIAFLESL